MNLNLLNQKFKTGFAKFRNNVKAKFDMRKILDLVIIMAMLPVLTGMLSGMSTGDPAMDGIVTAISAILPLMLLIDVFSGMTGGRN